MKQFLTFCFLQFVFFQLVAQNIKGKIVDILGNPIEFANILLYENERNTFVKGTISDEDGVFLFSNVQQGVYRLEVTMVGFAMHQSAVFEVANERLLPDFKIVLQENAEVLEEVAVTAKKPLFEQQIDRTVVNVQNSITSTGSTALEVLERSPGIQIDRMNNQVVMRGKQGVIVMINGKRTRMEAEGLIQLLQNMPSDNIQKIELITTPPASFDAEGSAGVINIVSRQSREEGMQGNASINGSYGLRPKYGASLNLQVRKKRFNFFADFSGSHNFSQEDTDIYRENNFGEQMVTVDIASDRPAFTQLYTGRLGAELEVTERTTLGVLFSGFFRNWDMEAQTQTLVNENTEDFLLNDLETHEINEWKYWIGNINLRHRFSEASELSFDFDYMDYLGNNPVNYDERNLDKEEALISERSFASTKQTPIEFQVAKLDYSQKWSDKLRTEIGVKGTFLKFMNDFSLSEWQNGERIFDPRFTDVGDLDEQILAAYLSTDYNLSDKWTAKLGVRYEYYDSDLNSAKEGSLLTQEFGRLYPSVFTTYQINENEQLQFSYAERINRPSFNELAPFFLFWGYNTVFAGNPQVRPTISQQLSASYKYKRLLFNFEYVHRENPLAYQPQLLEEENLFIVNVENMNSAKSAMFSTNIPVQVTDWWESRYNLSANWFQFKPVYEGEVITETNLYFNANVSQNFKLPKDFNVELNANLLSPRIWGLGSLPFQATFNLGIQKKLSENAKLTLNWNDLFNIGSFFSFNFEQPDLNLLYRWNYDREGNVFRLNFSWQFGNSQLKKVSERKTGSEEERRRVN